MAAYKLVTGGAVVIRLADGASIPFSAGNADYEEYLDFVAGGGVPDAADPPPAQSDSEVQKAGVKAWYTSHPNASLLFNLSIVDLDVELDDLVDDLFPTASAANKNRLKLWMKTVSHSVRALSKREGFT